jgi:hypothetical protein
MGAGMWSDFTGYKGKSFFFGRDFSGKINCYLGSSLQQGLHSDGRRQGWHGTQRDTGTIYSKREKRKIFIL